MRYGLLLILFYVLIAAIAYTGSMWNLGNWFGPDIPKNQLELATWSSRNLQRLEHSMDCNDVPYMTANEPIEVMAWRADCSMAKDYWNEAYQREKVEKAKERFR